MRQWGEEEGAFNWGTNTIVLERGRRQGCCRWQCDGADFEEVAWEAFNLGKNRARRPHADYPGSKRQARFRDMILSCDNRRCVLTKEETVQALDAAHLIPAARGENDFPFNGIALRADIHRLFDAGLFGFEADGEVVVPKKRQSELSERHIKLLQKVRLKGPALQRVKAVLASEEFRNRCP